MDRRFLTVLGVSLVFALVVSSVFYQMTSRGSGPKKAEPTDMKDVVVATRPLGIGVMVKPADVKLTEGLRGRRSPRERSRKWRKFWTGRWSPTFCWMSRCSKAAWRSRAAAWVWRPRFRWVCAPSPCASTTSPARRDSSCRACAWTCWSPAVRRAGDSNMTTTVLQNVLVLSAGQAMQADARGTPVSVSTVTLLVTPSDAETLTLANGEGRIQLVLRNSSDEGVEKTAGTLRRRAVRLGRRSRGSRSRPSRPRLPPGRW